MKNITRTEKMSKKSAWKKAVCNFLTQNAVLEPEDTGIMNLLLDEYTDCVAITDDNLILINSGMAGEPHDELYTMDWVLVAYSHEGTNFEWEYVNNKTVNEAETEKVEEEETTMMNTIIIATATAEEIVELARVTKITKLQDAEYVNRDSMVELAKANGMTVNRKTTRTAALEYIKELGNKRYAELKTPAPAEKPAAPETDAKKEAQNKTVTFMRKILNYADSNQKKGHGYTISAEYLKYFIFEVQFGVKKFKDYEVQNKNTQDFAVKMAAAQKVAKWVMEKGYLTAVTYKVSFDFGGKHFERCCYRPEFNGSDETKSKMFPIDKCVFAGAENVKWTATTYAVNESAQAWR